MITTCIRCRHDRPHHAHGQCGPCYRLSYAPLTGAGMGGAGIPKSRITRAARAENIAEMEADGEDIRMIALRLGVSVRTVQRYKARLREHAS